MRRCLEGRWRERSRSRERSPKDVHQGCSEVCSSSGATSPAACIAPLQRTSSASTALPAAESSSTIAGATASPELHFLYASPLDARLRQINVPAELELLSEALEQAQCQPRIRIGVASSRALSRLLTLARGEGSSSRRAILHLSAHVVQTVEQGAGLVLEKENGGPHVLYRQQLEDLLGGQQLEGVSLVFLNSCWSEGIAQILVEAGCPHVVATRGQVSDLAARIFMHHFYLALGSRCSVLAAWESAQQVLRIDSNSKLQACADLFVLFGQRNASSVSFWGLRESSPVTSEFAWDQDSPKSTLLLENPRTFLSSAAKRIPPKAEDFIGRTAVLHEVLNNFDGIGGAGRRACTVSGPSGIGKSATATELAHFASSPGRLFSRSVIFVEFKGSHECFLTAVNSSLKATFPDLPCDLSAPSGQLELQLQVQRAFQNLDRQRARTLLIIDDADGAVQATPSVRRTLSVLLEVTQKLCIVVFSPKCVYESFGSCKCVNIQLPPLSASESVELFLRRIHRPLRPCDLMRGASTHGSVIRSEDLLERLTCHPLLRNLNGNPALLRATGQRVTPDLVSLFDLCADSTCGSSNGCMLSREMSIDETPSASGTPLQRLMSVDETPCGAQIQRAMSVDEGPSRGGC